MIRNLKRKLFSNHQFKLVANHTWLYFLHLFHIVLDLLPFFIRWPILRLILGRLGRGTYFDFHVYFKFPWLVEIGSHVSVNRGVEFYPDFFGSNRIRIGDNVRIAPNVRFHAGGHDIADMEYRHAGGDITVGDNSWIGAGAIVLPGVCIGRGCVIGAGSVVNKDIPDNSVAAGVPAKVIRTRGLA